MEVVIHKQKVLFSTNQKGSTTDGVAHCSLAQNHLDLHCSVNPGLINHGLLIGGALQIVTIWYLDGNSSIKQPRRLTLMTWMLCELAKREQHGRIWPKWSCCTSWLGTSTWNSRLLSQLLTCFFPQPQKIEHQTPRYTSLCVYIYIYIPMDPNTVWGGT